MRIGKDLCTWITIDSAVNQFQYLYGITVHWSVDVAVLAARSQRQYRRCVVCTVTELASPSATSVRSSFGLLKDCSCQPGAPLFRPESFTPLLEHPFTAAVLPPQIERPDGGRPPGGLEPPLTAQKGLLSAGYAQID